MSLKDDMLNGLKEFKVWRIDIDRESTVKGQPAIKMRVYTTTHNPHEFTFAKANQMTTQHMLSVTSSYLRNRK